MAGERLWRLLPRPVRELPADLVAVVILVVLTDLSVLAPVVRETPLRIGFALVFLLFLPGYAFIASLFPEAGRWRVSADDTDEARAAGIRDRGIDGIERVVLSVGTSIAIVPLIGLGLNFTSAGIRLVPIVLSVSGFTLAAVGVAVIRRWKLPAEDRFRVPYKAWFGGLRGELFAPETGTDAALNLLLVASIVLALGSVGYAVAGPDQGDSFTEFYLLTENENGELVADDYPTEFRQGERKPVIVGIGNQEHEPMSYTVVVTLQRVRFVTDSNTSTVEAEDELGRFHARVPHNETWSRTVHITPTMTGERLRLAFLLYRADAPANPTIDGAYREMHLWVNVSARGSAAPNDG